MLRNLIAGARLAFFFRISAKNFRISPLHLWAIFLLNAGTGCIIDYYGVLHPARFNSYGLLTETLFFSLMLFDGFVISLLFFAQEFYLAIPVILLNAFFIPFALDDILFRVVQPYWLKNPASEWHYEVLTGLWFFLIAFRALLLLTGTKIYRQLASSLLIAFLLFLPGKYIYLSSYWYYSPPKEAEEPKEPVLYAEDILQQQDLLLNKQLAAIAPRAKGRNTWIVLFAGDGEQTVFMKEVLSARALLEEKFHARGHSIALINNKATLPQYPLATVANLKNTLLSLGHKADAKQDMLLLYLTSHGSQSGTVEVSMDRDIWLRQVNGANLKKMLKESGFQWKVIIISACYSGSFIDALKDDSTIIMTSARRDRTSFGCGDEFDMTYFGDALFKQALPKTTDFSAAFKIAKAYIEKREKEEHITPESEPQIYSGAGILHYLNPRIPPPVTYGPQKKQ